MLPESRTVDEFWASSTGAFRDEGVAGPAMVDHRRHTATTTFGRPTAWICFRK